VEREREREIP